MILSDMQVNGEPYKKESEDSLVEVENPFDNE